MATNETLIPIPGRLHSVASEGHVSGADEIYDDTQQKDQETINSELIEAVGTGGSVDTRIEAAVNVEKARAEGAESTLDDKITTEQTRATNAENALDGRVDTLEDAVGTGGSVDSRISAAVATEATRAQAVESSLSSEKADKATTLSGYGITDAYTKSETYSKTEINDHIDTPNQGYVTAIADSNTTTANLKSLIDTTAGSDKEKADFIYRVGCWDGSQYNDTMYSEYAWIDTDYVFLSKKSQIDEVFDISAYHANTPYVDLTAALGTNGQNIPQNLRKGGMSIKFVQGTAQSSDNKYVQYRLITNEWSTNTDDWAIADEGVYVENPEFVSIKTDREGKILWAIKIDGGIYYGAGCPQQVKDYIEEKISSLSLDEYGDIVAFLNDYLGSDTTLKVMIDSINERIPEIIENPEFLEVITDSEDNVLEGIQKDGTKVIGGDINVGGSASINGDTKILGNMEVSGVSYKVIENTEYLAAWLDAKDKVIFGLKTDGKTYVGNANFLDEIKNNQEAIDEIRSYLSNFDNFDIDALLSIITVENPEFIEAKIDPEGKLLAGRTNDGAAFEKVGFSTPSLSTSNLSTSKVSIDGHIIENIEDPEGRSEITTDADGKIISYRDNEGVKHEEVGIETNHLVLSDEGLTNLEKDFKAHGFSSGQGDWSDYISEDGDRPLHLQIPKCAILNLHTDFNLVNLSKVGRQGAVEGENYNIPTQIEFWDMQGNYFKKWSLISGQGNSTMAFNKKNIALDLFDTSVYDSKGRLGKGDVFSVKFGNWVAQDSFHLKANIIDTYRYINHLSYKLYDQMVKSRGIKDDYVWKKALIDFSQIGMVALDSEVATTAVDTGARCFPDGFPVIVYQNGEFWGIFMFSLKKHRDNYHLNKKTAENIHLDGLLDDDFFMANGNIDWDLFCSKKPNRDGFWDGIEVRNPKDLYCMDGEKYDADLHNEELIDDNSENYDSTNKDHVKTKKVKKYIEDFSKVMTTINAAEQVYLASEKTAADLAELKEVFETYFDPENLIDYMIHGDVTFNWDGFRGKNWQWFTYDSVKWYCGLYDCDSVFGYVGASVGIGEPTSGHTCDHPYCVPEHTLLFNRYIYTYYTEELEERYKQLRDAKILDAKNICDIFSEATNAIGSNIYAEEWEKWTYAVPSDMPTPKDSVYRLYNWIERKLQLTDSLYHYNQN